ncbi:MAG TPA: hypothetical protein ENK57_25660 [Polyangiaceae bacterium]|nr:hypothetical protein [Polyangiaceae bacterium]
MSTDMPVTPATHPDAFLRLPGLFRRWEVEQVLDAGHEFHIEEAGTASDGTQLFAVYRREHNPNPNQKEEA